MFHSAALRLTIWYLAIIMTLSIGCSVALYRVSSNELAQSASRPIDLYNVVFGPGSAGAVGTLRAQQLEEDKNHLKSNLALFNIAVLLIGGGVSYFLARRTLRPIEESLEMQKRFTGDASHELRTPLTAMQTEIEVALRNPDLTRQDAIDQLKSNLEEVGKLKSLSEGLLALATATNKERHEEVLSLKDVISQAIDQTSKAAGAKKIKITSKLTNTKIRGNPQQLVSLFSILLDNAIKYSPTGSQVSVSATTKDKWAKISITDRGKGIATADLPHIFERFYRADASRSKSHIEGYGLGLAIAKKITDLHKGIIEVKSRPAKGSTFTVRLPKT